MAGGWGVDEDEAKRYKMMLCCIRTFPQAKSEMFEMI